MPALKTLGLVILAVFVVSVGGVGFIIFRSLMAEVAAREALSVVVSKCLEVVSAGGSRRVDVEIPAGYQMSFIDNRVVVDGKFSELPLGFAENLPTLPAGSHSLLVSLSENRLVISWTW
jgi:hypothetical protein